MLEIRSQFPYERISSEIQAEFVSGFRGELVINELRVTTQNKLESFILILNMFALVLVKNKNLDRFEVRSCRS